MDFHINNGSVLPYLHSKNVIKFIQYLREGIPSVFSPSQFIGEMIMNSEERARQVECAQIMKDIGWYPVHFKLSPRIIIFQNFEQWKPLRAVLEIQNKNKCMMHLKMITPTSEDLKVITDEPVCKIAPGMIVEFQIVFTPHKDKDYMHALQFDTNTEVFYVPVIAIGSRPLLDVPDKIVFPTTIVKSPCMKIVHVRNIGKVPAQFSLTTQGHFKVNPTQGVLKSQEVMQLEATFEACQAGGYDGELYLDLETGEHLLIQLSAVAENARVELQKSIVDLSDTYVGLHRKFTTKIFNNSDHVVGFIWKKNSTLEDDEDVLERLKMKFDQVKELECQKSRKMRHFDVCDAVNHRNICQRILEDEIRHLEKEELSFSDKEFTIVPQSGEIWPHGWSDVLVTFSPGSAGTFSTTAYLEVTGRDSRLPLTMSAIGLSPLILLDADLLDLNLVYSTALQSYQVQVRNSGDIPGTIKYCPRPLVFGGTLTCDPELLYLEPGEFSSFLLYLQKDRLGPFIEKVKFGIADSVECLQLILRGEVVTPTLTFSTSILDFGSVAIGFPCTKTLTLLNTSPVLASCRVQVPSDGDTPAFSYSELRDMAIHCLLPERPKEFDISPNQAEVGPQQELKLQITLTANTARQCETRLEARVFDSDSAQATCSLRYHSHIASIVVEPALITLPNTYVNHPCTRTIRLVNTSRVPGFLTFVPAQTQGPCSMSYVPSVSHMVLFPEQAMSASITVTSHSVGRQTCALRTITLGEDSPREVCTIKSISRGPAVTAVPRALNFGEVALLKKVSMELVLENRSPIPTNLKLTLVNSNTPWAVRQDSVVLQPEEEKVEVVDVYLQDRGRHKDVLLVSVEHSDEIQVPLKALGVGSPLVFEPVIHPILDLGTLFCRKKYNIEIKVTNKGTKEEVLVWSHLDNYKQFAAARFTQPERLVFRSNSVHMKLAAGDSVVTNLQVLHDKAGLTSQSMYCIIRKELVLPSEMRATFVEPLVCFDKTHLSLWRNLGPYGVDESLCDKLMLLNRSGLPLLVTLETRSPFYLKNNDDELCQTFELCLEESFKLEVSLKPEERGDMRSSRYPAALTCYSRDHHVKASVNLLGAVNYPSVELRPSRVDFGCIAVHSETTREIEVVNVGAVAVVFTLSWNINGPSVLLEKPVDRIFTGVGDEVKVLDIVPFTGELEKSQRLTLLVKFQPNTVVDLQCEVLMSIVGGTTHVIPIRGEAQVIDVCVDTNHIHMGKTLFSETGQGIVRIINKGLVGLSFHIEIMNEGTKGEESGVINVTPERGHAHCLTETPLTVNYTPGICGPFDRQFFVKLGCLEAVAVSVSGYSVFPQVYLDLPRPSLLLLPPQVTYTALQSLTPDWLSLQHSNRDAIGNDKEPTELSQGWIVVSSLEVPSTTDLDLAVERQLASNLKMTWNPLCPGKTISDFHLPAYEVDMGLVVVGRTAERFFTLSNYGPTPAVLVLWLHQTTLQDCIRVPLRSPVYLDVGATMSVPVILQPAARRYQQRRQHVHAPFHILIQHGATVPVFVKATVTYPFAVLSESALYFGQTQCGTCKTMSLQMFNSGWVVCHWTVRVVLPSKKDSQMFYVDEDVGELHPAQTRTLHVSFKPCQAGIFSCYLEITVLEGLEVSRIPLEGEGMKPVLTISDTLLTFEPCLPSSGSFVKLFTAQNNNNFPIEYFISNYDEQALLEQQVLTAVMLLYDVKELLLPQRELGHTLPLPLYEFYAMVLDRVNERFMEERNMELGETVSSARHSYRSGTSRGLISSLLGRRGIKALAGIKLKSSSRRSNRSYHVSRFSTPTIFQFKSSDEINRLVAEYIKEMRDLPRLYDPVQEATKDFLLKLTDAEPVIIPRQGALVVFHGAPTIDTMQIAHKAARLNRTKILSIDRIVLEEAAASLTAAGMKVRKLIEESYWRIRDASPPSPHTPTPGEQLPGGDVDQLHGGDFPFWDVFEALEKKLMVLAAVRRDVKDSTRPESSRRGATTRSTVSKSSKERRAATATATPTDGSTLQLLAGVSKDLLLEVLRRRLSAESPACVVMENLDSVWLPDRKLALEMMLRAAGGTIADLAVVLLTDSYQLYRTRQEEKAVQQAKEAKILKEEKLRVVTEEAEEAVDTLNLTPEEHKELHDIMVESKKNDHRAFVKRREERQAAVRAVQGATNSKTAVPTAASTRRRRDLNSELKKRRKVQGKGSSNPSRGGRKPEKLHSKSPRSGSLKSKSPRSGKSAATTSTTRKTLRSKATSFKDPLEAELEAFAAECGELRDVIQRWDFTRDTWKNKESVDCDVNVVVSEHSPGTDPNNIMESVASVVAAVQSRVSAVEEDTGKRLTKTAPPATFSVLSFPTLGSKPLENQMFSLCPTGSDELEGGEFLMAATSLSSGQMDRKSDETLQSKKTKKRSSRNLKNLKSASLDSSSLSQLTQTRWILQPGQSMTCRVRFCPTEVGVFDQTYMLDVVGGASTWVLCRGTCDLPAIDMDPHVLFKQVAPHKPSNLVYTPTFFLAENLFDFGSIFFNKKAPKTHSVFRLKNKSTLTAHVKIALLEDVPGTRPFLFQPETCDLEPGQVCGVTVHPRPYTLGTLSGCLQLHVKDNPNIDVIMMKCHVKKMNFLVDPPLLDFGRMPLYRTDVRTVTFRNNNLVPVRFYLKELDQLSLQVSVRTKDSLLPALQSATAEVHFTAGAVLVMTKQPITVEVFDEGDDAQLLHTTYLNVSAEVYDVKVDVFLASPSDDHIHFGDVRVGFDSSIVFRLKNMGQFDLLYRLRIEKHAGHEVDLKVEPREGPMPPSRMVSLSASLTTTTELTWDRHFAFSVLLMDPHRSNELIATLPFKVSFASS